MSARIYRYQVPVDDQIHDIELHGDIVAVGCRVASIVEFWAWWDYASPPVVRRFVVAGTGHPLPDGARLHHGTAVAPGGRLVWHLLEIADIGEAEADV